MKTKAETTAFQSLADRAYEEIRAMILDLRLLPGETILSTSSRPSSA